LIILLAIEKSLKVALAETFLAVKNLSAVEFTVPANGQDEIVSGIRDLEVPGMKSTSAVRSFD
jgi:hypothetical protein